MNIYLKHLTKALNTAKEDRKILGDPSHERHQTVMKAYKALLEEKGYHGDMDNKTILKVADGSNLDIPFSVGECLFGEAYLNSMEDASNEDKIVYEEGYIAERFIKDYLSSMNRAKIRSFVIVDDSQNSLRMNFFLNVLEEGFEVVGVKKIGKLRGVLVTQKGERERS